VEAVVARQELDAGDRFCLCRFDAMLGDRLAASPSNQTTTPSWRRLRDRCATAVDVSF
jgi:hypothetical protein